MAVSKDIRFRFLGDATGLQKAAARASASMQPLSTRVATIGAKFGTLAKKAKPAGIAVVGMAALSARSFANFDDAMTKSLSIMGDISDAMRRDMSDAAREVGKTTRFGAEEAAEAFFFLASAGLTAEQSIAALPKVAEFATAGNFDLALATDLVTDAQSALGLASDDTAESLANMGRIQDVLVKANTLANASVQQFSESLTNKAGAALKVVGKDIEEGVAVLAAFADQGIKGADAGTALNIVFRDLQTKAIKNKKAFSDLGIAVFDSNGEMRNIADIVGDVEGALDGMSDEQKKATLAQLGFSDKSVIFLQTLLGQSDAIREYEEELRKAGGTTEEVAEKQLGSAAAQLDIAISQLKDAGLTLGEAIIPVVVELAQALADLVESAPFQKILSAFGNFRDNFSLGVLELRSIADKALGPLDEIFLAPFGMSVSNDYEKSFISSLRNITDEVESGFLPKMTAASRAFGNLGQDSQFTEDRLLAVQDALGLTDDELDDVIRHTIKYAEENGVTADAVDWLQTRLRTNSDALRDHTGLTRDAMVAAESHRDRTIEGAQAQLELADGIRAAHRANQDIIGPIFSHETKLNDLEQALRDAETAQQSMADVMRAAVDPIFAARRASLRYADVLKEIDEDGERTVDELLTLADAKLDLDAAFEKLDSADEINNAIDGLARTLGITRDKARDLLVELGVLDGKTFKAKVSVDFRVQNGTIEVGGATIPVTVTSGGKVILHDGGVVPGPRGQEVAAILQGGERVISLDEQKQMVRNTSPVTGGGGSNLVFNFNGPILGQEAIREIRERMVRASRGGATVTGMSR